MIILHYLFQVFSLSLIHRHPQIDRLKMPLVPDWHVFRYPTTRTVSMRRLWYPDTSLIFEKNPVLFLSQPLALFRNGDHWVPETP